MQITEFIKARLDEDELWALAASAPAWNVGPTHPGGVHWTWAVGGNWDPVAVDPTASCVGEVQEPSTRVVLRTVEAWPLVPGGSTLPHKVFEAEEVRTGDGGHIVRHDPARVLRGVEADRAILEMYETAQISVEVADGTPLAGATRLKAKTLRRVLVARSAQWSDHPDYDPAWSTP